MPEPALPGADPGLDALYRRVTFRLLPFLMLCYTVSVIDRLNISMAKLQMLSQLGFSEAVYGLGAGVFFLGYLLFDVPSNLILHKVGARVWIGRIMITWGMVSVGTAFVTTPFWFYVARFLLGLAEAGFFAGLVLYATYWFPQARRGRIFTYIILAVPAAGVIVGPLSGAIMVQLEGAAGLSGWQWVFVLEGLPSVLLGALAFRLLDSRIANASWLSEKEKEVLEAALQDSTPGPASYRFAVSGMVWVMCLICFAISAGMYVSSFWMPTLVHAAGVDGPWRIGIYSALPWLVAIGPLLLAGRSADRTGKRRWHVAGPLAVCAIALALSTAGTGIAFAVVTLSVATSAILVSLAQFWSLPSAFLKGVGAAGGIALINSVGSLAGFFSPSLIGAVKQATGSTDNGILIVAAVIALGGVLTMLIPSWLVDDAGSRRPAARSTERPLAGMGARQGTPS